MSHEEVPPKLEEASDVLGRIDGSRFEVELLQPWLGGSDEVDDLEVLPITEEEMCKKPS